MNDVVTIEDHEREQLQGHTGSHDLGEGHYAAKALKRFCLDRGLAVSSTFSHTVPTYYPGKREGKAKVLDYVMTSVDFHRQAFHRAQVWCTTGHMLQLANRFHFWDHFPLAVFFYVDRVQAREKNARGNRDKWDTDKHRRAVLHGEHRGDFSGTSEGTHDHPQGL